VTETDPVSDPVAPPIVIEVPSDALVVLIGAAGSGKSTLAARHFDRAAIISSDQLRALIGRDEHDQRVNDAVFERLHSWLNQRLGAGMLAVVDATNIDWMWRGDLIQQARRHGRQAIAIVLDLPVETCIGRNAARGRRVRPAAVREQVAELGRALDRLDLEGFAASYVLGSAADVDRVAIQVR
jgi:protein phosphatase